jgi:hypothetical protein
MTPKKPGGFEKDVLEMILDASPSDSSKRISQRSGGKLRVLDHQNEPVFGAEVRIAGVGRSTTDKLGYTKFYLPADDWYALVIKHDNHEEVLYQEKMTQGQTYIYRPDPSIESGRLCVLSTQ